MLTATSGYCFLNSAKTSGRMCRQVPSLAPTMISPRGTRSVSAIAVSTALRASRISSAYFWNSLPDAVIETFPPERSKSLAPTSSSRARIWEEMAGWVRKRFSAARENEAWRATSRKVWSWSKSMKSVASCQAKDESQSQIQQYSSLAVLRPNCSRQARHLRVLQVRGRRCSDRLEVECRIPRSRFLDNFGIADNSGVEQHSRHPSAVKRDAAQD